MPNEIAFAAKTQLPRNKPKTLRITARVKTAVDAMVMRGLYFGDAAREAGLTTRAMRLALEKPHVLAYYRKQMDVLRGAREAKNFHRLCEIADTNNGNPAVNAIRAMEGLQQEQTNKPNAPTPGVTIRIVNVAATPVQHAQTEIDAKADECSPS